MPILSRCRAALAILPAHWLIWGALGGAKAAAQATTAPDPGAGPGAGVLLFIGGFVVALALFAWVAGKAMGAGRPAKDDDPFFPIDLDDDEGERD